MPARSAVEIVPKETDAAPVKRLVDGPVGVVALPGCVASAGLAGVLAGGRDAG